MKYFAELSMNSSDFSTGSGIRIGRMTTEPAASSMIGPPGPGVTSIESFAAADYVVSIQKSYSLVFVVDGGDLSLSITDLETGNTETISGSDPSRLTSGKVAVIGTHFAHSILIFDDFKIENKE